MNLPMDAQWICPMMPNDNEASDKYSCENCTVKFQQVLYFTLTVIYHTKELYHYCITAVSNVYNQ